MFTINPNNNRITLTKGDTASMLLEIYDLDDKPYAIKPNDVITFTVKKSINKQVVITKTADAQHYIVLNSNDTKNIAPGLYVYDVQLTTATGSVYTVIAESFFNLTGEVS